MNKIDSRIGKLAFLGVFLPEGRGLIERVDIRPAIYYKVADKLELYLGTRILSLKARVERS
jgi:hypothetical protein